MHPYITGNTSKTNSQPLYRLALFLLSVPSLWNHAQETEVHMLLRLFLLSHLHLQIPFHKLRRSNSLLFHLRYRLLPLPLFLSVYERVLLFLLPSLPLPYMQFLHYNNCKLLYDMFSLLPGYTLYTETKAFSVSRCHRPQLHTVQSHPHRTDTRLLPKA